MTTLHGRKGEGHGMPRRQRILAVEDSPLNLAILVEMLADDYDLRCANCGEAGLALAQEFRPDLVLLDIMMPGIGGYATCERLRQDPHLRHVKIILISAKTEVEDRLRGYAAGADDFVVKPFNQDELLAKITVFLRLKTVEELDDLKSNVLQLLSHETRTPLNGILGSLQLLADAKACQGKDEQELIQLAVDSGKLLERLIMKGLLYSELRSGTTSFTPTTLRLDALVKDVIAEFAPTVVPQGPAIKLRAMAPVTVNADRQLLRFVCASLLDNAIRFSPPTGAVCIEAAGEGDQVRLSVTDSGPGILASSLPHVFDGLFSTDITHHSEGNGLSLAICKEIVEAHGGSITVDSALGQGACFTVLLPGALTARDAHQALLTLQLESR
jgi:two-component system, sensor histidine kinase and response regulator